MREGDGKGLINFNCLDVFSKEGEGFEGVWREILHFILKKKKLKLSIFPLKY